MKTRRENMPLKNSQTVSDEWSRLEMICSTFGKVKNCDPGHSVIMGVDEMDDAAMIRITATDSLVIASDFVRGSGFYLAEMGLLNYFDIGYYLVIANLSDIAAMGASPSGLTTIVRYSRSMTDDQFKESLRGIRAAADAYGTPVVGGDIGGYSADVFAATAFGFVKTKAALKRSGAQPGDVLCLTGPIGLPISALMYFRDAKPKGMKLSVADEEVLLDSWRRPVARIHEGVLLSTSRTCTACQDISDGLKATIEQLGVSSNIGFVVERSALPIHPSIKRIAEYLHCDDVALALSASVDFSLLFTVARHKLSKCKELFEQQRLSFSIIGEAIAKREFTLQNIDGRRGPLPGVEWKQQTGNYLKSIIEAQK